MSVGMGMHVEALTCFARHNLRHTNVLVASVIVQSGAISKGEGERARALSTLYSGVLVHEQIYPSTRSNLWEERVSECDT